VVRTRRAAYHSPGAIRSVHRRVGGRRPPPGRRHDAAAERQRNNSFRDKLGRYTAGHVNDADRHRRKAMTALTAKMARVAHAVIKTGIEYDCSSNGRMQDAS